MTADAYGMMALISYSLAGVCAVLTVIFFFVKHIRQVGDDLTGRTAERAIADLRQGKGNRSRFFGGEERSVSGGSRNAHASRVDKHDTNGSLKLRRFSADDVETTAIPDEEAESGTTLLAGAGEGSATTLLAGSASSDETSAESSTTLLSDAVESSTTLLVSDEPDACESGTALSAPDDGQPACPVDEDGVPTGTMAGRSRKKGGR